MIIVNEYLVFDPIGCEHNLNAPLTPSGDHNIFLQGLVFFVGTSFNSDDQA